MESHLLPALAVLGPGDSSQEEDDVAVRVGALAARLGWVVVSGGGPGVMEAVCRGAVKAGGLTVGILPSASPGAGYPILGRPADPSQVNGRYWFSAVLHEAHTRHCL